MEGPLQDRYFCGGYRWYKDSDPDVCESCLEKIIHEGLSVCLCCFSRQTQNSFGDLFHTLSHPPNVGVCEFDVRLVPLAMVVEEAETAPPFGAER